jgi:PAS domain S-box-containing protein
LRAAFFSGLGRGIPYLTYYPAVMIAAIIGGLPAGLLATFISAILAYVWIQQGYMTSIEWLAMAFFVTICVMISLLAEAKRRANQKVLGIKQNLEKLVQERTHELEKSEEHFRNLMEQSPLAIAIFTPEGQFTDVNPAWYRQWGLNREEATGVFARYNHRTDKQLEDLGVMPLVERAYAGESVVLPPIEYIGNRALNEMGVEGVEARSRWIQIHLYPIKDENGSVAYVVNTNVDITELRQSETKLEKLEYDRSIILDSTSEIIAFHDLDHNFHWVNKAYLEATGLSLSQVQGRKCYHVWGLDRLCSPCPVSKAIETGEPCEGELTPENQEHWPSDQGCWMVRATPVKDDDGSIVGAIEVAYDITERKRDEEKLIQAERRYRTVADFTYDWEYWKSPEGTFLYVSPSCEYISGYKPEEFINNPELFRELILPEDKTRWDEHHQKALKEKALQEIQFRIHKQDGQTRWIEHVCQPVIDEKGEFLGFRASNRDITLRKEAEETIKKSQDSLRFLAGKLITAQEEERRRLAREMHDDLTQRLALLAIEAGKLETESQKYDSSMHANLQEMKKKIIKLSKDIHDISRQIHPSILDDLGLVNAIKSECAAFTQREGINVEYETSNVPLSIPRNVKICIYRIIQESLRNIARHAGTDKAQVSLTCSDGNLFLTIRDNGIGFDTLHMQVRKGIGLRSIHERVRLIQGEFSVQSKPGEGTVIKVTAPFAKEQK